MGLAKKLGRIAAGSALIYSLASANADKTGLSGAIDWHPVYQAMPKGYGETIMDIHLRGAELESNLDSILQEKNPEKIAEAMGNYPLKFMEAMGRFVEQRYFEDPKFYDSLERLLKSERLQIVHAKRAFSEREIPLEYVSLGIVESRLRSNAVSKKKAVGAYQFTVATIQKHDKNSINESQDVRLNPFISAEFAAMELKKLFDKFQDWNLALARYNSSMPDGYLEEFDDSESPAPNLEGYVMFLGRKLKDEPSFFRYIFENLGYVAKINFMAEVLKESYPETFDETQSEQESKIYTMKNPSQDLVIKVKAKENLRTATRRAIQDLYGFTTTKGTNWVMAFIEKELKMNVNKVYPNQEIIIPGPKKLQELEERFGESLRKHNPHIRDFSMPLDNASIIIKS